MHAAAFQRAGGSSTVAKKDFVGEYKRQYRNLILQEEPAVHASCCHSKLIWLQADDWYQPVHKRIQSIKKIQTAGYQMHMMGWAKIKPKSNLLKQKIWIMIQAHCILLCIFYTKLMTLCAGSSRGHRTPDSQSCHHCSCQPPLSMQQHQMNVQDDVPNPLHQWTHQLHASIKQLPGNSGQENW